MQEQDKIENRNAVLLAQHEVIVDLILENQQFKNDQAKYSKTAEDATNYRAKVVELQEGLDNLQDQRDLAMKIIARLEKESETDKYKMIARELVAAIRINILRGTWANANIETVETWLKPWLDKLK